MDVAEFYQWVREGVNRGDTIDSSIPHYIKAAVREIENKRDWQKLEWWAEFPLTPADDPIISLPEDLKQIEFLRYNTADAGKRPEWEYVHKAGPEKIISRVDDNPELYWLNEKKLLVLDAKLDKKTRDFEIKAYRYSSFPDENAGTDVQHWLIDAIPTGLHAKVMMSLAPFVRQNDPRILQIYQALYTEAIGDLIVEDERAKAANIIPEMVYWPEHIPYDRAFRDNE